MHKNSLILSVDGIDKCGKDLILGYLRILDNGQHLMFGRSLISNIAFSELRQLGYNYYIDDFKNFIFIYLKVDKEDWEIRCKLTNEPTISYEEHMLAYANAVSILRKHKHYVYEFNTTHETPYNIAKQILSLYNLIEGNLKNDIN